MTQQGFAVWNFVLNESSGEWQEVCRVWNHNTGACAGIAPGEACQQPPGRAHVCMQCGSREHPRHLCPYPPDADICSQGHDVLNARGPAEHDRCMAESRARRRGH